MVHRISFVAIRVAPSHSQIPFPYTALIETTCTCRWCNFPANLFCHLHYSSYRAFLVLVWYKSYSLPSLIHIKREKKWFLALRVLFSKKSIASSSIPSLQRSYRFTLHPPLYASSQNEREKRNREHPRATIATWSTSRRSDGFRFPQDRRTPPPPAAGLARSERGARAPEHPPPDLSWLWVASPPPVTTTVSFITIFFKGTLFLFPFYLAPSYSHAKNRVLVNADREKTKQCASSEPDTLRSMKRLEGFMQDEKDCWSTNRKDFVTPI